MKWQDLSKKKKTYFILGTVLISALLWAFIAAGIITRNFNRSQLSGGGEKQEAQIEGIILTETKADHKYWEIYGDTASYSSDNKVALLTNCLGNFYDKDGEVSMSFDSSNGTYNSEENEIILYKNTRIVIKDGTILYADKLIWSGNEKPIVATGNIKIIRNNQFLATADKVSISPEYDNFKIEGHAVSKIYETKENK